MEDRDKDSKRRRLSNGRHIAVSNDLTSAFEDIEGSRGARDNERRDEHAPAAAATTDVQRLSETELLSSKEMTPRAIEKSRAADNDSSVEVDVDVDVCSICLSPLEQRDRAIVQPCFHDSFCFLCIRAWSDQSRKCPLCLGPIETLAFNIRSETDFQTLHLYPLNEPGPSKPLAHYRVASATSTPPRHSLYGRPRGNDTAKSERAAERALERRKYIYRERLFAKHVGSNRHTAFKPFSPQQFSNNPELRARVLAFVRRELQVFPTLDIPFLTSYLLSILSQMDLKSPSAIRLLSDFLSQNQAEHLAHEIVSFARSPCKTVEGYDRITQYGRPARQSFVDTKTQTRHDSKLSSSRRDQPFEATRRSSRTETTRNGRHDSARETQNHRNRSRSPSRDEERSNQDHRRRSSSSSRLANERLSPSRSLETAISPVTENANEVEQRKSDPPLLFTVRGLAGRSKPTDAFLCESSGGAPTSSPTVSRIAMEGTVTDEASARKERVRTRLLEEYRQALSRTRQTSTNANSSSFKEELRKRIELEKAIALQERQRGEDYLPVSEGEEQAEGGENGFSNKTKALLLARLEEEKSRLSSSLPATAAARNDDQDQEREGKEQALKALLKSKSQAAEAGRTKMQELKARLWQARQDKLIN